MKAAAAEKHASASARVLPCSPTAPWSDANDLAFQRVNDGEYLIGVCLFAGIRRLRGRGGWPPPNTSRSNSRPLGARLGHGRAAPYVQAYFQWRGRLAHLQSSSSLVMPARKEPMIREARTSRACSSSPATPVISNTRPSISSSAGSRMNPASSIALGNGTSRSCILHSRARSRAGSDIDLV
jgi:hypothetical protein